MPVSRYEVELTHTGYLYLKADLAASRFPHDVVSATVENGELVLWPMRGAAAGGLLLKQRNLAGERCVLISEVIPPEVVPGIKEAVWDEERFHLRIQLAAPRAVGSHTVIEEEQGRWVVYLEVGFWESAGAGEGPVQVTRRRIKDYSTRRDAEVAASWIARSTDRSVTRPREDPTF